MDMLEWPHARDEWLSDEFAGPCCEDLEALVAVHNDADWCLICAAIVENQSEPPVWTANVQKQDGQGGVAYLGG